MFKNYLILLFCFCFDNQTHISQQLEVWFLKTKSPSTAFRLWRTIQWRIILFYSMHRIRDRPNIPKSPTSFDFARFSNFEFWATTSLISSIIISIESKAIVDRYTIKNSLFFLLHLYPDSL